jgi:hypothetical protein
MMTTDDKHRLVSLTVGFLASAWLVGVVLLIANVTGLHW